MGVLLIDIGTGNPTVLASKESKRIVRAYNKVAKTLVAFEYLWYEAWSKSVDAAKAGLRATLIVRHPVSKKLFVNFDAQVLQLIREAKCLARMGAQQCRNHIVSPSSSSQLGLSKTGIKYNGHRQTTLC